jgi:hypothetical protein
MYVSSEFKETLRYVLYLLCLQGCYINLFLGVLHMKRLVVFLYSSLLSVFAMCRWRYRWLEHHDY